MSLYGSQRGFHVSRSIGSKSDLSVGTGQYVQTEVHGGNRYGQEYMDDNNYSYSNTPMRGGGGEQGQFPLSGLHQKAYILQGQCQDYLRNAEHYLQAGSDSGRGTVEADHYMAMARETIEQLKACALDLRQMGQPYDSVVRSVEMCRDQLTGVHMAIKGTMQRRSWGSRGSSAWEEAGWSFNEAMAWIGHQKHLIETSQWGDTSADIEQQLISHSKFHSSIQRSPEVDKAKVELIKKGDKANQYALDQEWDTLQKMSHGRSNQLREMQQIIEAISRQIMWVNVREEEELVFDWGDKNIDLYIPKKQESYSKLMSALEEKDKDLNKLKLKVDSLLKNPHPASEKIEAYMDTLQTQWSWLLQITKCIHVHLKENAAYGEFFKEANEMYNKLQKAHENIRKKFTSDRNMPLENLLELLKGLEKEKERIMENKSQVQHLVNKSKSIVRLRPRNPEEEKSSCPVMVQALCDFKQDQKVILKGNEGILKDNSQRSKWQVTGPGGLDMLVPSVCLLVPPPNSLGINLANKNEQYYEAILSVWNQLYINIKSLISWQYYVQDLTRINSLTITMLSRMRPEEYRSILKSLETHYSEFTHCCHGSEMFKDEDKRSIESQYTGAHAHYDHLLVQLPFYMAQQTANEEKIKAQEEVRILAAKQEETKVVATKQDHVKKVVVKKKVASVTSQSLTELHELRLRLEGAEAGLTQHIHICLAEDGAHDCGLRITQLESVQQDVDSVREEYLRLKERVLKELENMTDSDKATFLHSQLGLINERLGKLDECSAAYLQRLRALRALLQSVSRAEDIIKVHEARLTEKETTSLNPAEVGDYSSTLKSMRAELEGKRAVLVSMETELGKAVHWNGQVRGAFHRCDVDLSRYSEQVNQLSDRWTRIQSQIDSRLRDLEGYLHLLQQYTTTSSVLSEWIGATRQKHDALQATKIGSITALDEHLNQQKVLNSEIKGKRESVASVLGDTDACVNSIKDYELELASYSAGLETLLNIHMKRTMLQSPSTKLTEETTLLQTRYIELLTLSGDYNKYLGELHNNMETLKMRNTRIDLLEEELRLLKEDIEDHNAKNSSLEEALARYRLEMSQSQEQLLSVEEVKRSTALQCSATQDSLASTRGQLKELQEQVTRLTSLNEEEKRKRRMADERYGEQQDEHEQVLRRRQKELEQANWAKMEVEKSVGAREMEAEQLRKQLEEEVQRFKELEQELSKTSCLIQSTQTQYNEIVMERDALLLKLKQTNQDRAHSQKLEEELNHMKVSLESELRIKLCLQEENEKVKKDFLYWKGQYESKEGEVRQFNSEKEKLEREKSSLKTEIERLMRELREVEERNKGRLLITQTEFSELTSVRESLEAELRKLGERPYAFAKHTQTDESGKKDLDPATLVFDGVRKMVTAKQLLDCGVINKVTYGQLLNGQKTVREVSVDIKLNLKGTGSISGVAVEPQGKMSLTKAKTDNILSEDSAILLLEAQAATGHIVDPRTNEKMTVQEACKRGVVYEEDRERLLIAEAACLGYRDPNTTKLLSAGQAMRKGLIDRDTALRMLQAQESVGGIIDPVLSVFLPKDAAMDRDLIDEDLYRALNQQPECYLDPDTQMGASYVSLKRRCKAEPTTGLLILPAPEKPMTVKGLRGEVSVTDLMNANLLEKSDMDQLKEGKLTSQDIEDRLRSYLCGSTCIAGVYNEANDKTLSIYQAMKEGLLKPGTTLELLEAQAASGFMIDPVNNLCLNVADAYKRGLAGPEFKDKLLFAERAVTGYKDPGTDKIISLFQAIEKGLIEKGHGIRLLEAQIASGGIIDPRHSHRIEVVTAYKKGYFSKEMNQILTDEGDDSKGFFDPNNQDNLTYVQLKKRCIIDQKTGLVLLSIKKKKEQPQPTTQKNTLRKRRVVIVDPDTNKEMSVKEAYNNGLIDYEMFLELSQQECEWEEITITTQDGSKRLVIFDRKTEIQYDIRELLEKNVINQSLYDQYRSQMITLTQFADIVTSKTKANRSSASSSSSSSTSSSKPRAAATSAAAYSSLLSSSTTYSPRITSTSSTSIKAEKTSSIIGSSTIGPSSIGTSIGDCSTITRSTTSSYFTQPDGPSSPSSLKHIASISVSLACPAEAVVLDGEQSPVGAIFDMEALEKISISEAHKRGLVDSISAQRLLEAQACTGGIVNPSDGRRLSIQEASSQGIIENDMATRLKPAQKAYIGFEDIKCKHKMSAAEAMRENWLPYEAGHRFLEFQFVTGGLYDPELGRRRTIKEALKEGWLDGRGAQKLQDMRHHAKNLTCPKTKLKISYKEAMDNCLVEENTGVKMLQAASASSRGISSPYNFSAPGSTSGSRTGSKAGSRRGSVDLGSSGSSRRYSIVSSTTYSRTSFSSSSMS
ncbi:desmoplakin-A-like isoform X2 [Salvelinus fontinalis]|uniref:desmoplakin-A-like isoform X2 n=1 Tax=Salvelinus fontinalis TaxID=8038 RepID=UPI002485828A|nr:desmoplakin-A-like isoform X2 [Salvelinus fontinalis]